MPRRYSTFDRWQYPREASLALSLFRAHHTELNRLYWTHVPIGIAARKHLFGKSGSLGASLEISGDDVRRMPPDIPKLKAAHSDLSNWTRLASLMSLLSYFEIYLKTTVSLAAESDPGTPYGVRGKIDGAILLKFGSNHSGNQSARGICNGDWDARITRYEQLFGSAPSGLVQRRTILDQARKLRNRFGHEFGRDSGTSDFRGTREPLPEVRLSEQRLTRFMKDVYQAATSIDDHLRGVIGAYEIVWIYLSRFRERAPGHDPGRLIEFRKHLGEHLQVFVTKGYCKGMYKYFNSLGS